MARQKQINPFLKATGAERFRDPIPAGMLVTSVVLAGYMFALGGIKIGVALLGLPFGATYVYMILNDPRMGVIGTYVFNFLILGLARYISGVPLGILMDFHLLLTLGSLAMKSFFQDIPWKNAMTDLFLLSIVWFLYCTFQLINPTAETRVTWFSAVRGLALYMLLFVPIVYVTFDKLKDFKTFLLIWAIMSILASLKGIMQKHVMLDPWEKAWLDGPQAATHILFGKLRVFSFMSDAGQFGAAQGHAGLVFCILGASEDRSRKRKILYFVAGILALYGMMISGTRGALFVPIAGLMLFTLLRGNVKVMIIGAMLGIGVIVFFKYTTIGNGIYAINRMRTAFNPQDASLQVRIENQKKLKSYMASRPFGAGLGSTSEEAKKLAPHSMAAIIPTDSWYVRIWVETGVVGLTLHLFILFYILIKGSLILTFKIKDEWLKAHMVALASGMFGIIVASYGNEILAQMPTGLIMYSSMVYLLIAEKLEKEAIEEGKKLGVLPTKTEEV